MKNKTKNELKELAQNIRAQKQELKSLQRKGMFDYKLNCQLKCNQKTYRINHIAYTIFKKTKGEIGFLYDEAIITMILNFKIEGYKKSTYINFYPLEGIRQQLLKLKGDN